MSKSSNTQNEQTREPKPNRKKSFNSQKSKAKGFSQNNKKLCKFWQQEDSGYLMNNDLLLLCNKHTDVLIHQTKTKPRETLEFRMKKQMESFSFSPALNLVEEAK